MSGPIHPNGVCILVTEDGTIISSKLTDHFVSDQWYNNIDSSNNQNICLIDRCQFPLFDNILMSQSIKRSMCIQNAGGASNISEALSMYYMQHALGVTQFVPEMEIDYWVQSKMCDYLMCYHNENIGVSVTRAMTYPRDKPFTYEHATILLNKKLNGLIIARNCVNSRHRFFKSILHIWCVTEEAANNCELVYNNTYRNQETYSNIQIICTVSHNQYIYTNRPHTHRLIRD